MLLFTLEETRSSSLLSKLLQVFLSMLEFYIVEIPLVVFASHDLDVVCYHALMLGFILLANSFILSTCPFFLSEWTDHLSIFEEMITFQLNNLVSNFEVRKVLMNNTFEFIFK